MLNLRKRTIYRIIGGILVVLISFWATLKTMDYMARAAEFRQLVDTLKSGKAIYLRFDDGPEEREPDGRISCGPQAAKGFLGAFVAGQSYEITYEAATHTWNGFGPNQNADYDPKTATCAGQFSSYSAARLGRAIRPEDNELVLWGSEFKFDSSLSVLASGKRVGRLQLNR
jgi:hypothetical protein